MDGKPQGISQAGMGARSMLTQHARRAWPLTGSKDLLSMQVGVSTGLGRGSFEADGQSVVTGATIIVEASQVEFEPQVGSSRTGRAGHAGRSMAGALELELSVPGRHGTESLPAWGP